MEEESKPMRIKEDARNRKTIVEPYIDEEGLELEHTPWD